MKVITPLSEVDMKTVSEYPTQGQMVSDDVTVSHHQPSLYVPSNHNNEQNAPQAYVASLINKSKDMWGNKLDSWEGIQYVRGFWDWFVEAYQMLLKKNNELASALNSTSFDIIAQIICIVHW